MRPSGAISIAAERTPEPRSGFIHARRGARRCGPALLGAAALLLAASVPQAQESAQGYLAPGQALHIEAWLPPAPADDSIAKAAEAFVLRLKIGRLPTPIDPGHTVAEVAEHTGFDFDRPPDVPVTRIMWGTIPYVLCMMLQIVILCVFPEIATWLPDRLMGIAH